ncbi:hypothetical protein QFZ28_004391 [Neobacillus niacini]|uniref:DUF5348 domain-containing protein n=1 Tax=Neobacillus niacini TaxID=86668 RepID=UPI0027864699|nr:DUF5348 domain-containing protein [Neobacillus niacini]MDQ1003991.1 hypothetical protein [Neobacillus niacini]
MKKRWRNMVYNDFLDCWMIFWDEGKSDYKIRRGDSFELHLGNGVHLLCRMELGSDWYILVGKNAKFYLKPNEI